MGRQLAIDLDTTLSDLSLALGRGVEGLVAVAELGVYRGASARMIKTIEYHARDKPHDDYGDD